MKQAATEAGLGAYEVAEALSVRPPTVYRWWTGQSRTDPGMMARYAELVSRPQIWLEAGDGVIDYVAAMLRKWVDAAAAGVGGDKALQEVDARLHETVPELAERVRREAPGMLKLIEDMAGGPWGALTEEQQQAAVRRLVELLDQQRPPPELGAG